MNNFDATDSCKYNVYNMAPSDNQGPEQQMALMVDSENNSRHSTAGERGDSALTAFLRSKQQNSQSGTQHTNNTFDSFARDQRREVDDDVADDGSIASIDINGIENGLISPSRYKVPDDEPIIPDLIPLSICNETQECVADNDDVTDNESSIASIDINGIENGLISPSRYKVPDDESITPHLIPLSSCNEAQPWGDGDGEDIVPIHISDLKNDLIPLSSYIEDAVDEDLMWTEALMDHDDIKDAPLYDSTSSLNEGFQKLTNSMERSAFTRQELTRQYSEQSLGSTTSTATDISQHSFNHHDSFQLPNPVRPSSSSHSSTSSGLGRPRIKKKAQGPRRGLIRRHSHRSLSGQDITRRGLIQKDSLVSLNGSLNSISLHSSFRNIKESQDTSRSLMGSSSNLSLRVRDGWCKK
jgi:hypothetical protein